MRFIFILVLFVAMLFMPSAGPAGNAQECKNECHKDFLPNVAKCPSFGADNDEAHTQCLQDIQDNLQQCLEGCDIQEPPADMPEDTDMPADTDRHTDAPNNPVQEKPIEVPPITTLEEPKIIAPDMPLDGNRKTLADMPEDTTKKVPQDIHTDTPNRTAPESFKTIPPKFWQ